jgi:hypothetical protein
MRKEICKHELDFCFDWPSGAVTQVKQCLMIGFVVMLLRLAPGIFKRPYDRMETELAGDSLYDSREL